MAEKSGFIETFAGWVAGKRSKWLVLSFWIVVVLCLNMLFPQANSQVNDGADSFQQSNMYTEASEMLESEFPNEKGSPALIVWHQSQGLGDSALEQIRSLYGSLAESPLPDQQMIPPLHELPAQALAKQRSEDGTSLITPIFFDKGADAEKIKQNLEQLSKSADSIFSTNPFTSGMESSELVARITGPAGIIVDATSLFSSGDFSLTIATFLFVLIVLLIIYRSPILALIPLVGVGFAYGIISPLMGWLGSNGWIVFDSQGVSIMTVLLFGAGTDYCLFLISRYRHYLKEERSVRKALALAVSDKSGAIAMSGLTTTTALLLLLLASFGPIHRFSIPFVLAISIVALSSLTLVPALLAILGRASFFPFIPRTEAMEVERAEKKGKSAPKPHQDKPSLGERFSTFVVKRAKLITILTSIVLIVLASFALQIKYTYDTLSSFPEDMPSREGFALIEQAFQPGQLAPLKLIVDSEGNNLSLQEELNQLPMTANVSEPAQGQENENIVVYDVELNMNPYSNHAMDALPDLRASVENMLSSAGIADPQDNIWMAGQTAEQAKIRDASNRDAFILVPSILLVIALLVLLYLRSLTAMAYLMATVVVSYFSALGLGWIIIKYILGADAIQGFIPLYTFIFLGALGVDYNLFLKSSIWKKARHMPLKEAIKQGAAETGPVINSAGIILAGTFAVLATLPIQILVHFGLITAIGVLIDTFIVRPFLVPAITAWMGKKAFWPGKYEPQ